ncbi:HNH endonuclease [Caenispirillum salinarum]|uniref:HNH endonuclease n=1 Tax=Caenispirillum salinarum TaxID=859058 RepID=UPI00384EA425
MRRLTALPDPDLPPAGATAARDDAADAAVGPCPLCGRPMVAGPSLDRHHWVPRSQGGREQTLMHRICHRKIHSVLTERDLAAAYDSPDALRTHPEIARFLKWVRKKPPEYMDRHRRKRG